MRTNHPIRGLLQFYFYAQSGNLVGLAIYCMVVAAAAVITGHSLIYGFAILSAIAGAPYIIIIAMGNKEYLKWERFRLTMPIKRGDIASAQYFCILLAALVGFPLAVLVVVLTSVIHGIDHSLGTALVEILAMLANPLLFTGLVFPVASTKFSENKQELSVAFCLGITVAVNLVFIPRAGAWLGLVDILIYFFTFGIAVVVFVVSLFMMREIYGKKDF